MTRPFFTARAVEAGRPAFNTAAAVHAFLPRRDASQSGAGGAFQEITTSRFAHLNRSCLRWCLLLRDEFIQVEACVPDFFGTERPLPK